MTKIWTNSGDSHFLEPDDLWQSRLPKRLAELTPRAEKDPDGEWETVYVDGQIFRRKLPSSAMVKFAEESMKPQGSRDARARLADLDKEGVWGEVIFPSLGMWASSFRTPELLKACIRASNEWALDEIASVSDRYVVTAQVSTLNVDDAVEELHWAAEHGFKAVFLPTTPHPSADDWHRESWEPFWAPPKKPAWYWPSISAPTR
ncbi:putative amidohydrolase 2 [Mycobacterium xenopi 3993]|nr:putative amidohydrolase 2 [Mycobacterium xenopi 3993]